MVGAVLASGGTALIAWRGPINRRREALRGRVGDAPRKSGRKSEYPLLEPWRASLRLCGAVGAMNPSQVAARYNSALETYS